MTVTGSKPPRRAFGTAAECRMLSAWEMAPKVLEGSVDRRVQASMHIYANCSHHLQLRAQKLCMLCYVRDGAPNGSSYQLGVLCWAASARDRSICSGIC